MTFASAQFGSSSALNGRDSSHLDVSEQQIPTTLGDLSHILAQNPPSTYPMLKRTCSLLGAYLDKPINELSLDCISTSRDGFRPFLEAMRFKENSIRTYVNHARILLNLAGHLGWKPDRAVAEAWREVLALSKGRQCKDVVAYLARIRKKPSDVTIEDVDRWGQMRVEQGLSYREARRKKTRFWRLLRDGGCTDQTPKCLIREKNYGIPIDSFPAELRREANEILNWKQAPYAMDRPRGGQHRPVTAKRLSHVLCALLGYAVNIRKEQGITSMSQLVRKEIVNGFIEWCINTREVKGQTLQRNLRLIPAALRYHPAYQSIDIAWFKPLLDGIAVEDESELDQRKEQKYLEYQVLESIPAKIRAKRQGPKKLSPDQAALFAMHELLMTWLVTLPWRQRNIRECRTDGPRPNLFKAALEPNSRVDRPKWVVQEQAANPAAEFWQFRFSKEEAKKRAVHALLPFQLVGPLEEYLRDFRPRLVRDSGALTLFVNESGKPMTLNQMTNLVSDLILRHGGKRVTPHLIRDIFSFAWLKERNGDYLTLSKMLWHANINEVIRTYGKRFNESSGICAVESWLEERARRSK